MNIVWLGAEQCRIEQEFSRQYHGYERGDRDWFILKSYEWTSDVDP